MRRWAVVALALVGACSTNEGRVDAAVDAGPTLRRPPPRPAVSDGEAGPEVVVVLNEIRWDQRDDWARIGLDLDGLATIESDASTAECVAPAASAPASVDGVEGTDNALGQLVLPVVGPSEVERGARALQAMGIGALAVRVRQWTGNDDDPLVTADVFTTNGLDASGSVLVAESTVLDGDLEQPRARDDTAYVASGSLVMRIPERMPLDLAFGDATLPLALTDATIVVQFDRTATVAGRWSSLDLVSAAPAFGACPGTDGEALFLALLDLAADIRSLPGTGGPGVACDALSVGVELRSVPATLAGVGPPPALAPPCR